MDFNIKEQYLEHDDLNGIQIANILLLPVVGGPRVGAITGGLFRGNGLALCMVGWNPSAMALQSSRGHHKCTTRPNSTFIPSPDVCRTVGDDVPLEQALEVEEDPAPMVSQSIGCENWEIEICLEWKLTKKIFEEACGDGGPVNTTLPNTHRQKLESLEHPDEGDISCIEGQQCDRRRFEEQKKDFKEKDNKALLIIHQCVDDTNFEKIHNAVSAREAWNILVRCHSGGEKVKKVRLQTLRRQYEHMKMEDNDRVSDFFNRLIIVANQMKACGDKITDAMIMEKILRSMPAAFDHIVVTIEETRDMEKLKIEELQSTFEAHEMRQNGRLKRDDQALKVQHVSGEGKKKQSKWKSKNKDQKKWKKDSDDQEEKVASVDKKSVPRKQYSKEEKKIWNVLSVVRKTICPTSVGSTRMLKTRKAITKRRTWWKKRNLNLNEWLLWLLLTQNTGTTRNIWYVDSDCSNHMTYNRGWMTNLDESKKSKVRVADNSVLRVEGIGSIKIKRKNGLHATLENVLLVPEMKCNLLSVGQLTEKGYTVIMGSNAQMECLSSVKEDETWKWHLRFGHLNFKDLQQLSSKEMVSELPNIAQPHKEYVCGTIEPPTVAGNMYFVTFVDDFSRMKNEVLEIFKQFKKHTEREIERRIKLLRTDDNGITHEVIAAYTPEHNGLAERCNRTIMNMARCMLKEKNVVRELWGEAVATAVHVLNGSPTKRLPNRVPHAAWTGKKTSVKYFKIFGLLAFCHVADQKRVKLDDKGEAMVFVGYHSTGAYRLFDPIKKKITISRDVVVLEDESWNWKSNQTNMRKSTTLMEIPLPDEEEDEATQAVDNTRITGSMTNETRPRKHVVQRSRFTDYEVYSDVEIDEQGDIIHLALIARSEIMDVNESLAQPIWKAAMTEELRSIEKNKTWKLMDLPHGKQSIDVKWIFKTKVNPDGSVMKHKARLVAKGFLQKEGIDFTEVFAPVARLETIRIVVAITCFREWNLFALDVKSTFLHGFLEEEVYIKQPPGFIKKGRENQVYKLDKALYGLRQAPRAWNKRINAFFNNKGFKRCSVEHSLYVKTNKDNNVLIVCLYVDDLLLTGSSLKKLEEFKQLMQTEFDMTDMGELRYFLGMEFSKTSAGLLMHQRKYVKDILSKFMMDKCNEAETPLEVGKKLRINAGEEAVDGTRYKQLVRLLRFLCNSRPDIMFGGQKREDLKPVGYSDADFGGDEDDRKNTSGSIFFLHGAPVSWSSKKQNVIVFSSCESEYVAGSHVVCQSIWLSEILRHLKVDTMDCVELNLDNTSTINLAKNPISHVTELQLVNIFTKSLSRKKFKFLRSSIGMQSLKTLN
ncbi:hypothetical protein V8G54_013126 [Vigna mungo]|uniref:Integrase catalytic domain-containing protein n=1 Tax=Vigna mungo TaxID=3915 RepID=A0AAQ3NTJ0_VIGMU